MLQIDPAALAALNAAVARAEKAEGEYQRVAAALSKARAEQTTAESELARCRARLAESEASEALGEEHDKQVKKQFVNANNELQFATERVRGLEKRKQAAESDLNDARAGCVQARREFGTAVADSFRRMYATASGEYAGVIKTIKAAAIVLNDHHLHAICRGIFVPDVADPMKDLTNPRRAPWQDVPEAVAVHDQLQAALAPVQRFLTGGLEARAQEGDGDGAE